MGKHGEAKQNFEILFPNVARKEPDEFKRYREINGVVSAFITEVFKKSIHEGSALDLAGPDRKLSQRFVDYLAARYRKGKTKGTQQNILNGLLEKEISYVISQDVVTPEMARLNLIDPEKLPPFMKNLWFTIPRKGGRDCSGRTENNPYGKRASMELMEFGGEVFAALLEVVKLFDLKDEESLLVKRYKWIKIQVKKNVYYENRFRALYIVRELRRKLGMRVNEGNYSEDYSDLPPALREAIGVYLERGPHGLKSYPELMELVGDDDIPVDGHEPATLRTYVINFAAGVRKMNLPQETTLDDMLVLDSLDVVERGKVVGKKFFSPLIQGLQKAEREIENPGYKAVGSDSGTFNLFMSGFIAICRFNGIFHAIKALSETVKIELDKDTLRDQRFLMKSQMSLDWLDSGIAASVKKFDEIVDTQQFLHDEKALIICCGLPQLMTLRVFGYRQECIRISQLGKNIFIGQNRPIRFHFERKEIKNGVLIDQVFPPDEIAGMEEVVEVLRVLEKYRDKVLRVFERRYPDYYNAHVGKNFYVMPATNDEGKLVIKGFPVVPSGLTPYQVAEMEKACANLFYEWFQTAVIRLLDFSAIVGCEFSLFPHFLRAQCCQWMRDVLKWDWDRIEEAMGDLQTTLQGSYYDKNLRRQTANPFIQTSRDRLALREAQAQVENSVPLSTFKALNQSFELVTVENKELREEMKILQGENASLRDGQTLLNERVATLSQENIFLLQRIASLTKDSGLLKDPSEPRCGEELVVS